MGSAGHRDPVGPARFLVPWRPDGEYRDRLWAFCRSYWEAACPDIEIHTADQPGTFSRAASINRAARGDWDVAVILDADVVSDGEQVYAAIERALATQRLTLAFTHYAGLAPHMTNRVIDGYEGSRDHGVRYRSEQHESSIVAVPRALFDRVGGFDERFVGWGQEDVAFAMACRVLGGELERVAGTVWHLWHPRSPERDRGLPTYQAAQALGARYRLATSPELMQALLSEERRAPDMQVPDTVRTAAFTAIWRSNRWSGDETRSGPGSGKEATAALVEWLPQICEEFAIGSVLDAGCGECTWQPDLPGYIGVDVVREAIMVARKQHPDRTYGLLDICRDELPVADAVLCRDALQHLPLGDAQAAIQNFRRMGAKYLIASSHAGEMNVDVMAGGWYPCNLEAEPFWLGAPVRTVFDGHWKGVDRYPTKVMGLWALR